MRLRSNGPHTSVVIEKRAHSERLGVLIVVAGASLLLSAPYLNAYSYSTTVREGSNSVSISYSYPFEQLVPFAILIGTFLVAYGIFASRSFLIRNKRQIAILFAAGGALTLTSLLKVNHPLEIGLSNDYYYGFPLPALVKSIGEFPPFVSKVGWFPDLTAVYDLLFWSASAWLVLWLANRLSRLPKAWRKPVWVSRLSQHSI